MDSLKFTVDNIVFIASTILFISIIVSKTGYRFGVPTLVLFLGVGMLFGQDGLGLKFSNPHIAQFIGVIALNIILFSGGMDTKLNDVKSIFGRGVVLATLGVLLTALITGFFIYWLTNSFFTGITFSLLEALLLASVMSSTDSASVFAILNSKGLRLKERLRPLLEFESGSNDPMAYLLTISLIAIIQQGSSNLWGIAGDFTMQLVLGAVMGWLLGRLAVWLINKINLDNHALYPVLLLTIVFIIFSLTNFVNGNGYLAAYLSGLVIGNAKFPHKKSTKNFFDGMAWLFQIIMFITLGLLVNPTDLLPVAGIGLVVSLFLIVAARPISVWLCLLPFPDLSIRARHYVSWVGLRGAVPIIFATYPWTSNLPNAQMIFNIVFFVTLVSLLVQGTTVSTVAHWLGLADKDAAGNKLEEFDVEISDDIMSTMSEITLTKEHLQSGSRVMDMPMPDQTLVVMVKRDGHYFVPTGSTELHENDVILLISDNEQSLEATYNNLGITSHARKD